MKARGQPRLPSRKVFHLPALAVLAAILAVSWQAVPRAPHRILIFAGERGGGYHEYAERYSVYVRMKGLGAKVVETEGSLENLRRLASGAGAAVGFAQSGVEAELGDMSGLDELVSLGSLSLEPVWVFVPRDRRVESVGELAGKRVGLGPRGSGSWATAEMLLADNGLRDRVEPKPFDLTPGEAAEALVSGDVDALCLVGGLRSPVIAHLLMQPGVVPVSLPRTAAYARRHRRLAKLTLPEGAFDMARNIPDSDLDLIAPATNLVARADLHPAVVGLLIEAAREIHRPPSLLAEEGTFPSPRHASLPLSSAAATYLQNGQQGLVYQLLPFWLAGLLAWLVKLLAPTATVALFLFRILPGGLRLRFTLRVRHFFKRLTRLEKARAAGVECREILRDLDELDRDCVGLSIPRGMASPYFELRQALHDMRERLKEGGRAASFSGGTPGPAGRVEAVE